MDLMMDRPPTGHSSEACVIDTRESCPIMNLIFTGEFCAGFIYSMTETDTVMFTTDYCIVVFSYSK